MCKVIAIANQKGGVGKNTTTAAPTTVAPTTEVPTTVAPTTEAPTTMAPTTQSETSTVAIGEGSDVGKVNRKILNCKNDKDLAGSTFGKLCVKVKKSKKKAISLTWKKIQVAKTYVIYGAKCGTSYKKIATVHSNTFTNKKLKKGTYYKYMAVVSGKGVITAKKKGTCSVYVYAQNGVYKKIKIRVN